MISGKTILIPIVFSFFVTIKCFGQSSEPPIRWPEPSANLSVIASKDSVTVGECFVLTTSFNVADDNQVPLRFTELGKTVSDISSYDFTRNGWLVGQSTIKNVVGISKYEGFVTYEILKSNYCPAKAKPMYFPPVEIPMLEFKRTKKDTASRVIYFESKSLTIPVLPMPPNARVDSVLGSPLCGEYFLSDSILANKAVVNKILLYRITISADGFAALLHDPIFADNVDSHMISKVVKDTIINDRFSSQVTLDYQIIFRKEGRFDFSDVAVYHFWDPITKQSKVARTNLKILVNPNITKERANFTEVTPAVENIIAVDVSRSMKVQDINPSRIACARLGLKNFLMKIRGAISG